MKIITTAALSMALALPLATTMPSEAGAKQIERACMTGERPGSRPLCGCIQRVADQMLTRGDQRMASKFFKDPQKAQDTRQSGRADHSSFWLRYKAFGNTAASVCRS
ncbi:hypothetical protein [Tropicimonas sp. IMCC34011]|uniref:hypothetical protein n=1 Tax=Tropicimonas sp. IMCC34011 TaxID=2248759 RepID=UPI001E43F4DD|nr:hypothetical protein [Tropicimonas sp. IMCC34011]